MNWLLPAVAGFLALSAWDGHRKGFIKKSVGIVSLVVTLALTSAAAPYMKELLKEHTELYGVLQNSIAASDAEVLGAIQSLGLAEEVGGYLADQILGAAAFLITLLLVGVLVQGIAFSLGIAAKLPVLHGLNKTAGFVFGLAEGVLAVWIFFFIVTVTSSTETGGKLLTMIAQSEILSWIYRENILFSLLK